tara:strand:+ start:3471 stop:4148 length:678 start_codon:yes stop_codon:yes gene_type:complete
MKLLIASSKSWFNEQKKSNKFKELNIKNISKKNELNLEFLKSLNPRYIFFPHWNWKVDELILKNYECIAFHTSPLPYGRGGSPIQNLILNGFKEAPLCAIKMTNQIDAGPIYKKEIISLKGNLDQIFERIAIATEKMILEICKNNLTPKEQEGDPFYFQRLSEKDNILKLDNPIERIYDSIRMLDGKEYPKAFIELGDYVIEFSNAEIKDNQIKATAKFIKKIIK